MRKYAGSVNCDGCGTIFTQVRWWQRWCSKECRDRKYAEWLRRVRAEGEKVVGKIGDLFQQNGEDKNEKDL